MEAIERDNKNENEDEKHDPFEDYGYGIKAYFDLMYSFTVMFLVFSLLFTPVVISYSKGKTMNFMGYTLGNLG